MADGPQSRPEGVAQPPTAGTGDVAQPPTAGSISPARDPRTPTPPGAAVPHAAVPHAAVPHLSVPRAKPPRVAVPRAKPALESYRRNLPHFQCPGTTLFVTFCTYRGWTLPESVRGVVLQHCLHDHGTKLCMHGAVVMPDHVHLILTPLADDEGSMYGLAEIIGAIKGASAHSVNRLLRRRGHVWQDESFDHVLRRDESQRAKVDYVCANPIRRGLAKSEDEYPWLWREWIEGAGTK